MNHHVGKSEVQYWRAGDDGTTMVELIYQPESSRYILGISHSTVMQKVFLSFTELTLLCKVISLTDIAQRMAKE